MPQTTCTYCGAAYEAENDEAANDPDRQCRLCEDKDIEQTNQVIDLLDDLRDCADGGDDVYLDQFGAQSIIAMLESEDYRLRILAEEDNR